VAACRQAQDDALAASAFFASVPPSRVFGPTVVNRGDELDLTLAPNEVIQIDSLNLIGAAHSRYSKFCGSGGGGVLAIDGGPGVVNVGELGIGDCAAIFSFGGIVVNVPGRGRAIRFGSGVTGPELLAPGRTLVMGGTLDDQITFTGHTWVNSTNIEGLSAVSELFANPCN
jgi:hypothetical protein